MPRSFVHGVTSGVHTFSILVSFTPLSLHSSLLMFMGQALHGIALPLHFVDNFDTPLGVCTKIHLNAKTYIYCHTGAIVIM